MPGRCGIRPHPQNVQHLLDLAFNVKYAFNAKARRTHRIYLELSRLRSLYQIELDCRDLVLQASDSVLSSLQYS
jgi:hypothetical protein